MDKTGITPQPAIDEIVAWVHSGGSSAKPVEAIREFEQWALATGWGDENLVWTASAVVPHDLEPDWDNDEWLGDWVANVPEELRGRLEGGEVLSPEDKSVVAGVYRAYVAENSEVAMDLELPSAGISELKATDGAEAYVVVKATGFGPSFEEWFEGYFPSLEDAESAIAIEGSAIG